MDVRLPGRAGRALDRLATTAAAPVVGGVAVATTWAARHVPGGLLGPEQAPDAEALHGAEGGSPARALGHELVWAGRDLLDLHPRRVRRRVWTRPGHAEIEVRGLSGRGPRHQRLARAVTSRLDQLGGVRWAAVNAVTGQVLVSFDQGRMDVTELLETVREVEQAYGTREEEFAWSRPTHPSDALPVEAAAVELMADCVAVAAALVGRFTPVPRVPPGVRAAVALLDLEPPLRRALKRGVGPIKRLVPARGHVRGTAGQRARGAARCPGVGARRTAHRRRRAGPVPGLHPSTPVGAAAFLSLAQGSAAGLRVVRRPVRTASGRTSGG